MEDFGELCFCVLCISLLALGVIGTVRGRNAPTFVETKDGVVMNYDSVFDKRVPTGYYKLEKIEIETVVKK